MCKLRPVDTNCSHIQLHRIVVRRCLGRSTMVNKVEYWLVRVGPVANEGEASALQQQQGDEFLRAISCLHRSEVAVNQIVD